MFKNDRIRFIVLLVLVAVITALHYLTTTHHSHLHDIYRRLYYIPIVLGGVWFALRGGLGTSLLVSLVYLPHVVVQWQRMPMAHPEQYLELLLYNVIGVLTGLLVAKEHAQRLRAEQNARQLRDSYGQLRQQADLILEIEDQLRQADRLTTLGELSAGLAHEIRNPLGSIRGTAEILQGAFKVDDPQAEFTTILINEVDRLNQVLENYLRFARPEPGQQAHFSLAAVLDDVLTLTAAKARKQQVTVSRRCPELPQLVGDAAQYKQVFLNLVLNALQVMEQGGELTISGELEDGQVALRFSDTGPGLTAEQQQKVFQPFYTTRQQGTGLGLAITQRIVHNHGGTIEVNCTPGQGCCFRLQLPVADLTSQAEVLNG